MCVEYTEIVSSWSSTFFGNYISYELSRYRRTRGCRGEILKIFYRPLDDDFNVSWLNAFALGVVDCRL